MSGAKWSERQRRAAAVRRHREAHGDWCPGFGRPPHRSADLTADHVVAQADGGAAAGDLSVLCRSCNSRKNAVTRRPSRSRPRGSR
ncbi:HNH endonuclease [Corynebacterium provencense]|uniref:HNH endonuclease n=1 Tax=Corynebacterium provencense TaxID=1737425 RepID=UPI002989F4FA